MRQTFSLFVAAFAALLLGNLRAMDFTSWKMILGIIVTTAAWLAATYLTKPVDERTLIGFCRKIRPGGPGWRKIEAAARAAGAEAGAPGGWNVPLGLVCMMLGCLMVWAALFGVGYLFYGSVPLGCVMVGVAVAAALALAKFVRKMRFS